MLHLEYDITGLRGADYNPRKIDDADLNKLAESIAELGCVKPLIVRGDLLVAGHQRTKALRKLGRTTGPVYVLPQSTTVYDEVRFNQLHNGTDMDCGKEEARIEGGFTELGYQIAKPGTIKGNFRAPMAAVRKEICDLITLYGPWGGVVATKSGKVIHCGQYALSAAITRTPLTCFVIPDEHEAKYRAFLDRSYGVFCYDGLRRDTYIQTFAQMHRLRAGPSGKLNSSNLYENEVIPWLEQNRTARGIDFGSGQGDYAEFLRSKGVNLHDVELFRRADGADAIDMKAVRGMITTMAEHLEQHGQYDFVVCDSVMNSVDSLEAQDAVMTVLNMLCRPGGMVFFSGRKTERLAQLARMTQATRSTRYVEFVDEHGFSALFRKGRWFYQKFHSPEQTADLITRHGLEAVKHERGQSSTSWQVAARKVAELPLAQYEAACVFEFDQRVGEEKTIGMSERVIAAVRCLYAAS